LTFNANKETEVRFIAPEAKVLVVDDITTNLKVAEGLMIPYKMQIDLCSSGQEAIEKIKQVSYDLVFMDHMMPEMDGIEATAHIRTWEAEQQGVLAVPIIALTANAVVGMREMFIEKGFNDFLAKPIDISKLDEMLNRWIPRGKKGIGDWGLGIGDRSSELNVVSELSTTISNNNPQSPVPSPQSLLQGVDIQRGISMTGGTMALYRQVLNLFCKDAEERLPGLQNVPETSSLPGFVIQVHALKSASASIGASDISVKAAELEAAGKAGDIDFIREKLPGFAEALTELVDGISAWEDAVKEGTPNGEAASNGKNVHTEVLRLLHDLAAALENENAGDIDRILEEFEAASASQTLDAKTKEALEKISDNVLMAEFDSAEEIVRSLLKG
jgi:CheY-like chemotaxis protein/HPt (histidine-containing phosphotransfer) domain-containing protein